MAEYLGGGGSECLLALQRSETEMSGCREIVQEVIRSKIIGKVKLGQQVAVEITCRNCIGPGVIRLVVQHSLDLLKMYGWVWSCSRSFPEKQVLVATVVGP